MKTGKFKRYFGSSALGVISTHFVKEKLCWLLQARVDTLLKIKYP